MNRNELVTALARKAGVETDAAGSELAALQDVVTNSVKDGGTVARPVFLSFERVDNEATTGRNPATGAEVGIDAKSVPKVKIGAGFKKAVNGG